MHHAIHSCNCNTVSRLVGTLQSDGLLKDELAAHLVSDVYYRATVDAMQSLANTNTVQFYPPPPGSDGQHGEAHQAMGDQAMGDVEASPSMSPTPPTPSGTPACDLICLRTRFIDDELTELLQELASGM